jgi:hypothetical protein
MPRNDPDKARLEIYAKPDTLAKLDAIRGDLSRSAAICLLIANEHRRHTQRTARTAAPKETQE